MQPQNPRTRPATQVPSKSPTSRQPAVRPPTQVHKGPTTRMPQQEAPAPRSTTRSVPRRPSTSSPKSSLPLILGIAGGVLALVVVIAIAVGGSGKKKAEPTTKKAAPAAVDVSKLEADGMRKCEEGVVAIQRAFDIADKAGLQRGVALITEGNQMLDKANQLSGHTYDTKKYNETLKMARGKLLEMK